MAALSRLPSAAFSTSESAPVRINQEAAAIHRCCTLLTRGPAHEQRLATGLSNASAGSLPFKQSRRGQSVRGRRQPQRGRSLDIAASHGMPGGGSSPTGGGGGGSGGSLVDANLWKLQKRIEMVRMEELSTCAPTEWEEWEKHFYAGWCLQVSHLLLTVQSHLLAVRPSLVLPAISLAMVVTPTLALFYAAEGFDQFVHMVRATCLLDVGLPIIETTMV